MGELSPAEIFQYASVMIRDGLFGFGLEKLPFAIPSVFSFEFRIVATLFFWGVGVRIRSVDRMEVGAGHPLGFLILQGGGGAAMRFKCVFAL